MSGVCLELMVARSITKLFSRACQTENVSGMIKAAASRKFCWDRTADETAGFDFSVLGFTV